MEAETVSFVVERLIECYTSLSDWYVDTTVGTTSDFRTLVCREELEVWLAKLREIKATAQQTGASPAMLSAFTPRIDTSYLMALAKYDLGHLDASASFLDRVPFLKTVDSLHPRACLLQSEQIMLRVLLNDKLEGKKAYHML